MNSFAVLIYGLSLLATVGHIRHFHREHDVSTGLPQFLLSYLLFGSSIIALVFGIYIIGPLLGFGALFIHCFANAPKYLKALRRTCPRNRSFVLLLFATLGIALVWSLPSQNQGYALFKGMWMAINLVTLGLAMAVLSSRVQITQFIHYSMFWIILYVMLLNMQIDIFTDIYALTRGYEGGENRIVLGRTLIILVITTLLLYRASRWQYRLSLLFHLPLTIFILLTAGARGPILSIALALVIVILFFSENTKRTLVIALAAVLIVVALFKVVIPPNMENEIILFQRVLETDFEDKYSSERNLLAYNIIDHFTQNDSFKDMLFGYGFGDSAYHLEVNYPHNFIVELIFELGLVGSLLSVFYIHSFLMGIKHTHRDRLGILLLLILLMHLVSAMFSGALHTMLNLSIYFVALNQYEADVSPPKSD